MCARALNLFAFGSLLIFSSFITTFDQSGLNEFMMVKADDPMLNKCKWFLSRDYCKFIGCDFFKFRIADGAVYQYCFAPGYIFCDFEGDTVAEMKAQCDAQSENCKWNAVKAACELAMPTTQPTPFPTAPTMKPTYRPTTSFPTLNPVPPTKSPTHYPTPPTTLSPTTASPTKKPSTATPTTKSPTSRPTTKGPTTKSPTLKPTTKVPTLNPITNAPSSKPTSKSPTASPFDPKSLTFDIELVNVDLPTNVFQYAVGARTRWQNIIRNDIPGKFVFKVTDDCWDDKLRGYFGKDKEIDDVLIFVRIAKTSGSTAVARAGACHTTSVPGNIYSRVGIIEVNMTTFNTLTGLEDLKEDILTHEMGHVIGFGANWDDYNMFADTGAGTTIPYVGKAGTSGYQTLGGIGNPPIEDLGAAGTRLVHWKEARFGTELMTGVLQKTKPNPMSVMSVKSFEDIGYTVDQEAAEDYNLPQGRESPSLRGIVAAANEKDPASVEAKKEVLKEYLILDGDIYNKAKHHGQERILDD